MNLGLARRQRIGHAPGEELSNVLGQVTAAVTALDKGTGDEAIANRVLGYLSQALQTLSRGQA